MRVKKYKVDSLPDAMQMIRDELGQDAIILDTKKVKTGGFMRLFRKPQIEVLAAVDKQTYAHKKAPVSHKNQHAPAQKLAQATTSVAQPRHSPARSAGQAEPLSAALPKDELLSEVQFIKKQMIHFLSEQKEALPPLIQKSDQHYAEQGILSEIRAELLEESMKRIQAEPQHDEQHFQAAAYEDLKKFIGRYPVTSMTSPGKMACFVGPTGVGKTTTIAKLAAHFLLNQRLKVGLITADTYRIAAVEQLRTYANILNLPLEVVYTVDELKEAYVSLADLDIILMDTPGRNYLERKYIAELQHLLPAEEHLTTFLVLSMTSKYNDLKNIVQNFQDFPIDHLVLTKTDETFSYGNMINLLYDFSIPITYLTNGQNVPDDLLEATPSIIADMIWGEGAHIERSS